MLATLARTRNIPPIGDPQVMTPGLGVGVVAGYAPTVNPLVFDPYGNKPAGYDTVETDYDWSYAIPVGGDTPLGDGSGWNQIYNNGSQYIGTDATAPRSPSAVLEWQYNEGDGSPTESAGSGMVYRSPSTSIEAWYVSFPVWHDATFPFNAVSNKLFYFWNAGGPNILESRHFSGDFLAWQFESVSGVPYYPATTPFGEALSDSYFLDTWVNIEIQYVMHATNGIIRVWAGRSDGSDGSVGQLVSEYTGINVPLPGFTNELNLNSTWGGGAGPIPRDGWRRIDHTYISHP